ncbi:MAG: 1-acyl-sn-glycerol-3-phosphate acyltransferase [Epsilonproteobacteria bacterium]|nr:MAG: 1-acyl-sn-glycerol-3-phosphate acyltransferase [Campylobacterota bacterium]
MLKKIFFTFIVRPIVLIVTGVHVRGKEHLPMQGAAIVVSNHNSHLDTMVLMSLYPISRLPMVRPVAAFDYFMKNKYFSWFSQTVIGIIPLKRKVRKEEGHPFAPVHAALNAGETIIIFPEGSRGKPEEMLAFKTGVAHLSNEFSDVPVVPIYIHGAGKTLPKGEALFVPFIIDVIIGKPMYNKDESHKEFTARLEKKITQLELKYKEKA